MLNVCPHCGNLTPDGLCPSCGKPLSAWQLALMVVIVCLLTLVTGLALGIEHGVIR